MKEENRPSSPDAQQPEPQLEEPQSDADAGKAGVEPEVGVSDKSPSSSPDAQQSKPQREEPQSSADARFASIEPEVGVPDESPADRDIAESVADEAQPQRQVPAAPGVVQTVHAGGGSTVRNVQMAGRDITEHTDASHPSRVSNETRALVRVVTLAIGVAGLIGGVIWLLRAVPGFTPQFLVPLLIIIVAVVLGTMGILKPDQIVAILTGQRDSGER
jgi:hypothetical protein